MKRLLFIFLITSIVSTCFAQDESDEKKLSIAIGVELQGYPTGLISAIQSEFLFNNANALTARVGYNFLNHRNLGVHDSEKGGGFGFSIGYKRYFENEGLKGFYVGAKKDIWINKVNWAEYQNNDKDLVQFVAAQSKIVVLQPTIELGYRIKFANDLMSFAPSIAFGYEWNIKTTLTERNEFNVIPVPDPEQYNLSNSTGQGIIALVGFSFLFSIK